MLVCVYVLAIFKSAARMWLCVQYCGFLECRSVYLSSHGDRLCVNNSNSVVSKFSDVFSEIGRETA